LNGGNLVATIDDIVKMSGVSRSTVCRFLSGSNVRPAAKKAIIEAMERLNYKSDVIYKQKNIRIEISISDNFESFKGFAEVFHGITEKADEKGVAVNIARRSGEQIKIDYSKWNIEDELKGVIVIGKTIKDEEMEAELLVSKGIPHVFVNRVIEHPNVNYVAVDSKKAAYDIVRYLIKMGHKNILAFGTSANSRVDRDKIQGYIQALTENDMKVSENCYQYFSNFEERADMIKTVLQGTQVPTAYFGLSDSDAMMFIRIAQSMGYRIPEDIAVVGMNDVESGEYFKPSITTVRIPFKKMGMLAVDHLLQLILNNDISCMKTIVKHELVIRESSGGGVTGIG